MRDDDDLLYAPPERGLGWLNRLQPVTCLCVGTPTDDQLTEARSAATEVRVIDGPPWTGILHQGFYAFRTAGEWHALAVVAGLAGRAEDQGRFRFTDGGHLVIARSIHEKTWPTAARVDHGASATAFAEGDVVRPEAEPASAG